MVLKASVAIYLAVGIVIGIVIGLVAGYSFLLQTPQQVVVTGTVSDDTTHVPIYVLFAKANGGSHCYPVPKISGCYKIANVTVAGAYSISLENNQEYAVSVGYNTSNSTGLISVLTADWCASGYLFISGRNAAVSFNATCNGNQSAPIF